MLAHNVSLTKLSWPRKNGPSSNLDRALSISSKAAPMETTHFSIYSYTSLHHCVNTLGASTISSPHLPASSILFSFSEVVTDFWKEPVNDSNSSPTSFLVGSCNHSALQLPQKQSAKPENEIFMCSRHTDDLTSGKREGPSKFTSIYRIKSRLSPFTALLCSSDGTYIC